MADGYNIDELRAAGLSEADIAELLAFDITEYQKTYQANQKAYEDAMARGLTAAQATGLSDKYVALFDPSYYDLIPGTNAQIMGRLGLIPQSYDYAPVFNIKGDQEYENYNFVPVPGKTYRLVDNNTGEVIGTATNAAEAKGLAEAANAISEKQGGNANWALQEYGSWSDGKGNMTSGYSDVYTNKKTGFVNDVDMLVQAAGIMAMAGAGLAAATAQTAAAASTGAAAGSTTSSLVSSSALASSTAANVNAIANIAASEAVKAGLTEASSTLLAQVGMGALRGGVVNAALGGDPIEGAITGGFTTLGSTVLGPAIESVRGAGEVATNVGSSIGGGIGTFTGNLVLGNDIEDSFVNGLISGAAQYVSTEVANELKDAKQRAANEVRSKIQEEIYDKLDFYRDISDLTGLESELDEIIINATKEYGENFGVFAAQQAAAALAERASSESEGDTGTDTKATTTSEPYSDIGGQVSENVRENLADKILDIQEDLNVTGNSAAGLTAAKKAMDDLIVSARNQYGEGGARFVTGSSFYKDLLSNALTVTGDKADQTTDAKAAETVAGIGDVGTGTNPTVSPTSTATQSSSPTAGIGDVGTGTNPTVSPTSTATQSSSPTTSGFTVSPTSTTTQSSSPTTSGFTVSPTSTTTQSSSPTTSGFTVSPTSTTTQSSSPTTSGFTVSPTSTTTQSSSPTTSGFTVSPTSTTTQSSSPTTTVTLRPTSTPTDPRKWTTQDWIMLALATPNLINRITGRGEDVGTISPDRSAVNWSPLNRQRGIGTFDPFTYGQEGPGYQTAEFEFFKPYTAPPVTQTYTPASVTWTPGENIYEYTPEEFSTMQQNATATYNQRNAAFNNYQQELAKQVESGAMTLAEAQREARAYAEPFGGAIMQSKADGGYIGYAEGGEPEDDMVRHLLEYRKGGGHDGPGHVKGIGSGQEDKIPAWLSDGEYVWSAQDVADLGDGSTDEGVRRLDKMRQMVRKQAGRKDIKKIAKPQKGIDQMLKAVGGKV